MTLPTCRVFPASSDLAFSSHAFGVGLPGFRRWTARERTIEEGKVPLDLCKQQRTSPRPIGGADVQTIDSVGWHGSRWPSADNSASTRSSVDPCARPDYTNCDHFTGTVTSGVLSAAREPRKDHGPFQLSAPRVFTTVTSTQRVWRAQRRFERLGVCRSRSRAHRHCNTGENIQGTMARFISSTCSLVLYPLAVPRILFQRDKLFRAGRFRPLPTALA